VRVGCEPASTGLIAGLAAGITSGNHQRHRRHCAAL